MRWARWLLVMLAVCAAAGSRAAAEINWQEAVGRLAQERSQAETCVVLLKRYGDAEAVARGALVYGDAKAEYDGVIAKLDAALAGSGRPESLPDLEAQLRRGFDKRATFCRSVQLYLSPSSIGTKGVVEELVSGTAAPLMDALTSIWARRRDEDALLRETIRTQLEAMTWPPYASVSP
jgi:hypothetical protein